MAYDGELFLIMLILVLCIVVLLLLPWLIVWLTYWWPRLRYRSHPQESCHARAVYLHDGMPYLHNRWGRQVEPLLKYSLYYVTFKAEGKNPMKFRVSQEEYYRICQGDEGVLTYRGACFVGFVKHKKA